MTWNTRIFRFQFLILLVSLFMLTLFRVIIMSELKLVYRTVFKQVLFALFFIALIGIMIQATLYLTIPNDFERKYKVGSLSLRAVVGSCFAIVVVGLMLFSYAYVAGMSREEVRDGDIITLKDEHWTTEFKYHSPLFMQIIE